MSNIRTKLTLKPGELKLAQMRDIYHGRMEIDLNPECFEAIDKAQALILQVLDRGEVVYGINTGFGLLANTRIERDQLETLQRSIVLSHSAGVGEYMSDAVVRLLMVLKINSLARGYSGIRLSVIEALLALYNHQVYPCIPVKGSVGASGDLAPLAHMSAILLGEGEVRYQGQIIPSVEGLQIAGLQPLTLAPKEGLALLNGTQASTALALRGLFLAEDLFAASLVIGALTVEAALGSRRPFDDRIHAARGHKAQSDVAACYRELLHHSEIEQSHVSCDRVQDPYSLRCQPQIMGACLQQINHAAEVLEVEANGVTDNPLVFADEGEILSGGNFHAEPVAMVADNLALAIAETGSLSERRMALLIDSNLSQLPPFLVDNGGVNSGFMIAQVTSAALASENKSLAHPASVDSLPTSANQEDHVSMATFAARRLADMADNTEGVLAVELLAACQGLDFRKPLKSSEPLEQVRTEVRAEVPFYDKDRYFSKDIEAVRPLIREGRFNGLMTSGLLPSL